MKYREGVWILTENERRIVADIYLSCFAEIGGVTNTELWFMAFQEFFECKGYMIQEIYDDSIRSKQSIRKKYVEWRSLRRD